MLGGSFNPAHAGHREISLAALNALKLDAVWWLVSPGNPLKDKSIYAPYEDRLAAARKTAGNPHIVVSDFERRHNLQYTVDTVARLQTLNPSTQFIWLMGADSLAGFHEWKDWRRLASLVAFAVFNRPGYAKRALASLPAKELSPFRYKKENIEAFLTAEPPAWIFFTETENPLSSTKIRSSSKPSQGGAPHRE